MSPRHSTPGQDGVGTTADDTTTDDTDHHGVQPAYPADRESERRRFGGIKWGSALLGWLAASGTGILLTALVAAAGVALRLGLPGGPVQVGPQTAGLISAIAVLVILVLAYYSGGYVAARMARFNGTRQGLAVWIWAVVVAAVALLASLAGALLGGWAGTRFHRRVGRARLVR